ncbi:MAG TPA: DUF4267 domain-containing protein [Pseudonocardiaceae bacterium]|nr:DUF4267 domain-containing protein [Pseudonocardiaceae bacterium]
MHIALIVLVALIVAGLLYVGVQFLRAPEAAAAGYGVPASSRGDARAYLSIKGMRDGVSGLIVLALLLSGLDTAVALFLLVGALIPIGDAVIVLRNGGSRALAYGMHAVTAVVMMVVGVLLLV